MYDLSYFNLGFRSDSVSGQLDEIRNKKAFNSLLLDDAYSIIDDCLKINDEDVLISSFSPSSGYEMNTLVPLLFEVYSNQSSEYIIDELNLISETIDKAKKDDKSVTDNEIDRAINFFSKLADLCLSNSTHQSINDQLPQT